MCPTVEIREQMRRRNKKSKQEGDDARESKKMV